MKIKFFVAFILAFLMNRVCFYSETEKMLVLRMKIEIIKNNFPVNYKNFIT